MKYCLYYFVIINLISFIFYGIDKEKAKHKSKSRISEAWLLSLGVIGGSLGSIFGMYVFRHKTKKLKFYLINYITLGIWIYLSFMFIVRK